MAEFTQKLMNWTLDFEGRVYENVPNDPGGPTKWGITEQDMIEAQGEGMGSVDFNHDGKVDADDVMAMPPEFIERRYCAKYWCSRNLSAINSTIIAQKVFDLGVNMGLVGSTKVVQRALVSIGFVLGVDGHLGPQSIAAINKGSDGEVACKTLLDAICNEAEKHYLAIVAAKPTSQKFLKGWLRRAHAIPPGV